MIPWINKYSPKTLQEVIGQEKQIETLNLFIQRFKKTKKPILLYGGTGNGKTSSTIAYANDKNYELVEMNASDTRNANAVNELLNGVINQTSLFGTEKLILVDEVEGLSGTKDRGGLQAFIKIIKKSKYPFVMICEDAYIDKLKPLRKISELIEYKPLTTNEITNFLKKICEEEKIKYEETALTQLARMSGGDIRAGINDLQALASKGTLTKEDITHLDSRDSTQEIENALFRVFKTLKPEVALPAFDNVTEDLDKIFLWVEENIPQEYLEPEAISNAYDSLSIANVFHGRIRRWQYYRFYVYCYNLLSAGIALAKKEKNTNQIKYKPSSRLLKIWILNNSVAKRKSIAQKSGKNTHTATHKAFSTVVPYLQLLFYNENKDTNKIIEELELSEEEITWLKKPI